MIVEIKKPRNTGKIKDVIKSKAEFFMSQTFDTQDMSQVNRIVERTSSLNVKEARERLQTEIEINYNIIARDSVILIIFSIIVFLIPAFSKNPISSFQYISLVLILIILLITGATTPMIDLEAKISQMTFMILEHPVNFENQVLFFQTKSILDVFWVMITHETVEMKFVGVLVVMFSLIFPATKLTSSIAYYYDYKNARHNKWVNFFVLKSGKWSMADVLVVAIFMAYIGFNGIITSQFGKLQTASKEIVVLTTNGTSLQPGFYVFFTFVILAMFLTMYLKKKLPITGDKHESE
jgi:Paraquat-inducible protein A